MGYETELAFFRQLMTNIHIQTALFTPDDLPQDILGMHVLSGMEDAARTIFESTKPHTIYFALEAERFAYAYLRLPDSQQILLAGPYLLEEISDRDLMQFAEKRGISPALFPAVRRYVGSLSVLVSENYVFAALCTLGETLFGSADAFGVERVCSIRLLYGVKPTEESDGASLIEATDYRVIEERYKEEKRLMHLISQGHTHRAQLIVQQMRDDSVERRTPDYLRNLKNYAVVFNTLARKAVEEGGVHPMHIDRISSQMAHRIEASRTAQECRQLFSTMVHKYCLLVKNHSMKSYPQLVQHVVLRIESDLTADLSLKAHAEAMNVNASYLSTLFKKETGQTLTDYVSRKRMDHAIFLLNSTDMQVQTIAQYCGMPDVNYFTKTFKRIVGKTPKAYRMDAKAER